MSTNLSSEPDWWKLAYNAYNLPLSGPVQIMQNLGFYNINNSETGEQGDKIEKRVIEEVGSYGRQLGWIMEALDIVLNKHSHELSNVTEKENNSLFQFRKLIRDVEGIKVAEQKSKPSKLAFEEIDLTVMLNYIHGLKKTDEGAYMEMITRIKDFLIEEEK